MRRRTGLFLLAFSTLCQAEILAAEPCPSPSIPDSVRWLEGKSREMIRASRRTTNSRIAAFPPQAGSGYDAFWLRDYAYMLEGCPEAFSDQELCDACKLFVASLGADGAGVDCVKFDGTPIYKPGYGKMGENPVADGGPFTIAVAWHTHRRLQDRQFVAQIVGRLIKTMEAVPRNPQTGMVYIKQQGWDRCPYGFTDSVRKQGDELFTSLLWVEAARRLADLLIAANRQEAAGKWQAEADRIAGGIPQVFWDDKLGLFRAATLKCREPDIWGSAFAVYLGVADREHSLRIARYFRDHYAEIVERGQLRHLPGGVYWEAACGRDTYQNGGYWATPVGWFVYALDLVDAKLANQTLLDLVADFQQRGVTEWVRNDHTAVKNYIASATMPLAGARRMLARRSGRARFVVEPAVFIGHTAARHFIGPGAIRLASGEILMAAPWGRPPTNFDQLAATYPVPMLYRSADGGRTWSEDGRLRMPWRLSGMISDGGITFLRLQDGRLALLANRHVKGLYGGGVPVFSTSSDDGKTWAPAQLLDRQDDVYYVMNDRMIQTAGGRLVVPVSCADKSLGKRYYEGSRSVSRCYLSDDSGKTWRLSRGQAVLREDARGMAEPCVAEAPKGRLLMLARTGQGCIYRAWSEDRGESWTQAEPTTLVSACSSLTLATLPDRRLIVFYNHTKPVGPGAFFPRTPLVYAVSNDHGQTWSAPVMIDDEGLEKKDRQNIYPAVCFIPEGILVIYSMHAADPQGSFGNGGPEGWRIGGGKRCILCYPE